MGRQMARHSWSACAGNVLFLFMSLSMLKSMAAMIRNVEKIAITSSVLNFLSILCVWLFIVLFS